MSGFWTSVKSLRGMPIPTPTGRARFTICDITDRDLTVNLASTGNERRIERFKFEEAYRLSRNQPITPHDVRLAGLSVVHTTYVAAVVDAVVRPGRA
jgi:hypothetical protein